MKRSMIVMMAAAMLALTAGAAFAHPASSGIDRREVRQHVRIVDGRRCGDLTRAEARRLRAGQAHVRRVERRAKADGHLSARERARIHRSLDRQSAAIYRLRHNTWSR